MTDTTLTLEPSRAGHVSKGRKEFRDEQLFARLIGAAVLLALAVIVLPFVLDGSGTQREYEYAETLPLEPPRPEVVEKSFSSRQPDATPDNTTPQTTTQLPEAPTRASVEVTVPEITSTAGLEAPRVTTAAATGATTNLAGQVAAAASGGSAAISAQPAATPAVTDDGTIASTPIQAGWNIQVASFVRDVNAIKLLNKLRERNLPAYANRVAGDTRSVIRVVVGPYANQIDALASQNRIDQDFRVESLMVKR